MNKNPYAQKKNIYKEKNSIYKSKDKSMFCKKNNNIYSKGSKKDIYNS